MLSRLIRNAATIGVLCLGIAGVLAPSAGAAGQVESFLTTTSASQAGGHPDLTIVAALKDPGAPETAKTLTVEEPAGLSTYMYAVPRCSLEDLAVSECSPDSQVGLATVRAVKEANSSFLYGTAPVYAVKTGSDEYGRLAFKVPTLGFIQSMQVGVRSGGDVGVRLTVPNLPVAAPLRAFGLTLWGVPADPAHEGSRFPLGSEGCPGMASAGCNEEPTASAAALNPLTGYPAFSCSGTQLPVGLQLETYGDPGAITAASSTLPGPTGCGGLSFAPEMKVKTAAETRSATGLDLDLTVPQDVSPSFPTQSPAKSFALDFSGGVRLDPTVAAAYPACSEEQAAIAVEGPGSCPAEAKVGTVRIGTPLVPDMLGAPQPLAAGSVRVVGAHPRQAPAEVTGSAYFGGVQAGGGYRLYLLGSGFGINLKLAVTLAVDPESGGLIASANLPKFPISEIALSLLPGTNLLRTPLRCDDYPVLSTVSTWNASLAPVDSTQPLSFDSGPGGEPCPGPVAQAHVGLSPSQLHADGVSTTTATATVLDGDQIPVAGEEVEFSATDPNLLIGPVTDNEDGTYSSKLTASNTIGTPTITATVTSVDPEVSGSAPLHLVSPSGPPAPPQPAPPPIEQRADPIPKVKFGKHPPARTRKHRVAFTFSADISGSSFFCKVDGGAVYKACTSPTRLSGLKIGKHRLSVYAVSSTGAIGTPSVFKFKVLPPKPKAG